MTDCTILKNSEKQRSRDFECLETLREKKKAVTIVLYYRKKERQSKLYSNEKRQYCNDFLHIIVLNVNQCRILRFHQILYNILGFDPKSNLDDANSMGTCE